MNSNHKTLIDPSVYFSLIQFIPHYYRFLFKVSNNCDLGPPQLPCLGPSSLERTFLLQKCSGQSQQAFDISLTFPFPPLHSLYIHLLVNSMMALHKTLDIFYFFLQLPTGKHITFYKAQGAKCKTPESLIF